MSEAGGFGSLMLPEEIRTCMQAAFAAEEPLSADSVLDTIYHCGQVAVGQSAPSPTPPPSYLLTLAETHHVPLTVLMTSLT